jgi:hypothetical protein
MRKEPQYSGMTLEASRPFLDRPVIPLASNRSTAPKQSVTPLPPATNLSVAPNKTVPPASNTTGLPANIIDLIEQFNLKISDPMDIAKNKIEIAKVGDKLLIEAKLLNSVDKTNAIIQRVDKPTLSVSKSLTAKLK